MTITNRLELALQRLNELMEQGHYFNPAIGQVCTQYGLTESEYSAIVNLFESQV
jgi:hypothetical protein